ncbi:MAG: hypothetical protein OXC60_19880 [Litoreibacter sp.]|nr:hypothetical protein [Litoreibacter sp.]
MKRLSALLGGRKTGPSGQAIYDRLDACNVPFRASVGTLVERYGTHPLGWVPDIDICVIEDAAPFIKAQSGPIVFEVSHDTALDQPPQMLRCAVRKATAPALNYARAIAELSKQFGRGEEMTHPERVQRGWSLGGAEMLCFVHPPDRPVSEARARRIAMFPDRASEAAIHIFPNL